MNEKLIEEAAKAIYNDDPAWGYIYEDDHGEYAADWDHLGEDLHEKFRSLAKGALAVFEKAHIPTDDEREADWDRVHDRPADIYTPPEDRIARPSVEPQGEPSSKTLAEQERMLDAILGRPKVQGEPSDAQVLEASKRVHAIECGCPYDGEHTGADIERRDRIARAVLETAAVGASWGVVTDAQVEAAAMAIAGMDNLNSFHLEKARAALRAANGVR
jgi:hypothetical protein